MKVFTCNSFKGVWPVGTAAVIVAESKETAFSLLSSALSGRGMKQSPEFTVDEIDELDTSVPSVEILCDGDY